MLALKKVNRRIINTIITQNTLIMHAYLRLDRLSKMLLLNSVGVMDKVDIYAMRVFGCWRSLLNDTISIISNNLG